MCDKKEKRHRRETTTEETQRDGRFFFFFFFRWKKIMRRKYKNQKQWWMFRPWSQTETKAFYRWRQKKKMFEHTAGRRCSSWTGVRVSTQNSRTTTSTTACRSHSDGREVTVQRYERNPQLWFWFHIYCFYCSFYLFMTLFYCFSAPVNFLSYDI